MIKTCGTYGKTKIVLCKNNDHLGKVSASQVATVLRQLLQEKDVVRAVFSAAESQLSFLRALRKEVDIDWQRVECFNVDEFWDVKMDEAFTCASLTKRELYDHIKSKKVSLLKHNALNPEWEVARFEVLIKSQPIDLICIGIGISGHLALNEPDSTRFDDPDWVRLVKVSQESKIQLMQDPHFKLLGYIPE